jgi:divalent metal cation (Fe/Co/Zn/Cd) transporter
MMLPADVIAGSPAPQPDCTCPTCIARATPPGQRRAHVNRGLVLAGLTVGWNVAEGLIAITAGVIAGSVALIGFGMDSFVEVLSGLVVLWRLLAERRGRLTSEVAERRAVKLIALSFFALAAFVVVESGRDLLAGERPEASALGLAITAVSIVVMPLLAWQKRRLSRSMGSEALRADSVQTSLCVYLSATVFIGLAANALLGWWWADGVAALLIAAVAVREGVTTWTTGDLCDC